jgi:hypothetical protein
VLIFSGALHCEPHFASSRNEAKSDTMENHSIKGYLGMKRKHTFNICGGSDFFFQMKSLFNEADGVTCVHVPSLPESLLIETVPSAWFFESSRLTLIDTALFDKIAFKIQSAHSLGLLFTKSIEEVFYWRQMNFKPLHLLYGVFTGQQIVERVNSLYEERYSLNLPKVILFSDPENNHVLLEKRLADAGLRVRVLHAQEASILPEILITEGCSALIWNLSVDIPDASALYGIIQKDETLSGLHVHFTRNGPELPGAWYASSAKIRKKVQEASKAKLVADAILSELKLDSAGDGSRDRRCGIVDQKHFFDFLRHNVINRHLEFTLPQLERVRAQWGDILVHTLANELFFYVKNHVRLSDLIGRGVENSVLLCCLHSDEEILKKVAERVRAGFERDVLKPLGIEGVACVCEMRALDAAASAIPLSSKIPACVK